MTTQEPTPQYHACQVIQSKPLGSDYHLLTMVTPDDYEFHSGQYVRMQFADQDGGFERYYSIANAPNIDRQIQFCIQTSDARVSSLLSALEVGTEQLISPAAGGFRLINDARPVLLIAGGSGISPIRSFFFQMTEGMSRPPNRQVDLVYGVRDGNAIPGKEEFLQCESRFNPLVKIWLSAETNADLPVKSGRVIDFLEKALHPASRAYVCGPPPMITAVREYLGRLGLSQNDILQDPF